MPARQSFACGLQVFTANLHWFCVFAKSHCQHVKLLYQIEAVAFDWHRHQLAWFCFLLLSGSAVVGLALGHEQLHFTSGGCLLLKDVDFPRFDSKALQSLTMLTHRLGNREISSWTTSSLRIAFEVADHRFRATRCRPVQTSASTAVDGVHLLYIW